MAPELVQTKKVNIYVCVYIYTCVHIYILNTDLKVIESKYIVKKMQKSYRKWDGRLALEDSETSDGNPVFYFTCL